MKEFDNDIDGKSGQVHEQEDENVNKANTSDSLPAKIDDVLPDTLFLLPVSDRPFFPIQNLPISVSKEWSSTIHAIRSLEHPVLGVCLKQSNYKKKQITSSAFHTVGTVARVHQIVEQEDFYHVFVSGIKSFRIRSWIKSRAPFKVIPQYLDPIMGDTERTKAYTAALMNIMRELLSYNPIYKQQLAEFIARFGAQQPWLLAEFATVMSNADADEMQAILEESLQEARMDHVLVLLRKELELVRMQAEIEKQVQGKLKDRQREYFLKEQLHVIQKELGIEKDDKVVAIEQYKKRVAALDMPKHASDKVDEELQKLGVLEMGSPEYAVTRNYLDTITSLPWGVVSQDAFSLKQAREKLNAEHAGLEDVKQRILEFLAVGAQKKDISGARLLLVGPPGVGKTSIARSVASVLGRNFYNFSVGGMRDEAEIKGHRKTYIGAMPGKIIKALIESKTSNPVIVIDEIDKLGSSYQGDPASALLEVLDPEQNQYFLDHYLDLRFDLSKILFICTANQLDTIPSPLRDRLETTRLSGYITEEKISIAQQHLWPKLLRQSGMLSRQIKLPMRIIHKIVEGYARDAGVRTLERKLNALIRKSVVELMERNASKTKKKEKNDTVVVIDEKKMHEYLGNPIFRERTSAKRKIGVTTGLAWTSMGGETLQIEAVLLGNSKRSLKLTGQLGQIMQESAEIALSYLDSNAETFNVSKAFFNRSAIHLHVPEGATPKDGPSAGITMTSALLSLAKQKKIRRPIAMTGEITLLGAILAVGGIREKVVAAKRAKIKELILPAANERDFVSLPENLKAGFKVHFLEDYRAVASILF